MFSQDGLLGTDDFLRRATERGHNTTLDSLRVLHEANPLVPLYRVDDEAEDDRRIDVARLGLEPVVLDGGSGAGLAGYEIPSAGTLSRQTGVRQSDRG